MKPLSSLEQAIAQLECHKHWTVRTINRAGQRSGHECVIWGEGRRVCGQGATPLRAIKRAIDKLYGREPEKRGKAKLTFGIVG